MLKSAKKHARNKDVDLQEDIERIKSAITEAAFDVRSKAESALYDTLETARARSANIRENLGDYVKDKPFKTIGLSMLAGMFIGYLITK